MAVRSLQDRKKKTKSESWRKLWSRFAKMFLGHPLLAWKTASKNMLHPDVYAYVIRTYHSLLWRYCSQDNVCLSFAKKSINLGLSPNVKKQKRQQCFGSVFFTLKPLGISMPSAVCYPRCQSKMYLFRGSLDLFFIFTKFSCLSMWLGSNPTHTYDYA